jgi:hypothetical protein
MSHSSLQRWYVNAYRFCFERKLLSYTEYMELIPYEMDIFVKAQIESETERKNDELERQAREMAASFKTHGR